MKKHKLWRDLEIGEQIKIGDRHFFGHGWKEVEDGQYIGLSNNHLVPHQRLVIEGCKDE